VIQGEAVQECLIAARAIPVNSRPADSSTALVRTKVPVPVRKSFWSGLIKS
jgi:hypothetical protein